MERSQSNCFPPRGNGRQEWQKRGPPHDHRPPNQLEATNMVNHEAPPYCRTCEYFHEESTCPVFCQINEQGLPEMNNYVSHSIRSDYINNVNKPHPISK
jgi:hypothetical protein